MALLKSLWPVWLYIVAYIAIMIAFQGIAWLLYFRSMRRGSKKTRGYYYP